MKTHYLPFAIICCILLVSACKKDEPASPDKNLPVLTITLPLEGQRISFHDTLHAIVDFHDDGGMMDMHMSLTDHDGHELWHPEMSHDIGCTSYHTHQYYVNNLTDTTNCTLSVHVTDMHSNKCDTAIHVTLCGN